MLIANKSIPQGRGLAVALLRRAATLELGWDQRQRSRFDAVDSTGRLIGVFLPRGAVLRGGDVLVAEDGTLVLVRAAPQPVLVVRHCREHGAPSDLLRAAYHLGNRHVAVEVQADHLQLEPDPVLAEMLRRRHLLVTEALAPFEPEGGAYGSEGGHEQEPAGPGHAEDPKHGHDHGHDHGHGGSHDHAHVDGQDDGHAGRDQRSHGH